jgi:hypothetical protein
MKDIAVMKDIAALIDAAPTVLPEAAKLRHYLQPGGPLTLGSARQQYGGPQDQGRNNKKATPEDV